MLTVGVYGATGQVGGVDACRAARARLSPMTGSDCSPAPVPPDATSTAWWWRTSPRPTTAALTSPSSPWARRHPETLRKGWPPRAPSSSTTPRPGAWTPTARSWSRKSTPTPSDRIPKGIVANPNCTTMVCHAGPGAAARRGRAASGWWASTYQAVSGRRVGRDGRVGDAGAGRGRQVRRPGLRRRCPGLSPRLGVPWPIAFNVLPHAGAFVDDETDEEIKFRNESRKILGVPDLAVSVTCVRVPVYTGHSLALNATFGRPLAPERALRTPPGCIGCRGGGRADPAPGGRRRRLPGRPGAS